MSQHENLRDRIEQHKVKNKYSKKDDKNIKEAADAVLEILKEKYPSHTFTLNKSLLYKEIEEYSDRKIDEIFKDRKIIPDAGVFWMDNKYPILIGEAKRQGTNDERQEEGKKKQATGNAIERLGKNVLVSKVLFEKETIFPFICFCWGCDFLDITVLSKLFGINGLYPTNCFYTDLSNYKATPFSIFHRLEDWSVSEMVEKMLFIAENSIRYFENKR